ncbi:MAG: hypothetical protein C0505_07570 [Leptothrix sp. (in: Bacteria)]|nr:hypothetical protein [Leptothrix sp. (in: b-proteobacteria)]
MNKMLPLMQREWLQHRFGWMLMVVVPLAIALLLLSFGQLAIGPDTAEKVGDRLPPLLAIAAIAGSGAAIFLIAGVSSLIIIAGVARRDHGDRSIEFWLSLPTTHSASLAAPLIVHLLLVPALALLAGLAGGLLVSLVLVTRVVGVGAWFTLPWGDLLPAVLAIAARLMAGLPLAVLWLSPLILLVVLVSAWFRRWAWVIIGAGLGLGGHLLDRVFGQPLLSEVTLGLIRQAGKALVNAGERIQVGPNEGTEVLRQLPGWALHDFGLALRELPSPLLAGGLLFAAGCFALFVAWRQRGAGAAG